MQGEAEFSKRNQYRLQDQYGDQIMNLSSNKLPKGLIDLEVIFNLDDQVKGKGLNIATKRDDYVPVAIVDRRTLNLEKVCFETEKKDFIHLCQ